MDTSYFHFLIGDCYDDVDGGNFYSGIVVWFSLPCGSYYFEFII
jgi:hypothetical protein